jgi:hypothetical protein
MVLKKITLYVTQLFFMAAFTCNAAYANSPELKINSIDVPVATHHEHSFLSIQVAQEPANLFDAIHAKNNKAKSTKFFDTHGKKISSKIRLAEQHFVSGSKAEYMLVVKRHSLLLKFQYSE